MPRGFGSPSGVIAAAAPRFVPFFLGASVGGGIDDDGMGVLPAMGVFELEGRGLSSFTLAAAAGKVAEAANEESFEGGVSSLMAGLSDGNL